MRTTFSARPIVIALLLTLIGCASIQAPPGGPEDKTPPALVLSTPKDRDTSVALSTRLHFLFTLPLDRSSFQAAFTITPYLNGNPKFHWSGYDEVWVDLPGALRKTTTYTVQLSRDLKSRRGNQLKSPARLTFSTGPKIDTGTLAGTLSLPLDPGTSFKSSDLFLFAYDIDSLKLDTLNFEHTPPDLISQPDDKFNFQFLAMKIGHHYRVFAVQDVYRNHVYDRGVDAYGMATSDPVLDSVNKTGFLLRMASSIDTTKPELQDVEMVDSLHIRARFSEALDTPSVTARYFKLSTQKEKTQIPILAAVREHADKHPGTITLLLGSPLVGNVSYTLDINRDSIHDLAKNPVSDSLFSVKFDTPDQFRALGTVGLSALAMQDSGRDIRQNAVIQVILSDAVRRDSLEAMISIVNTNKGPVPLKFIWADDEHVGVRALDTLAPSTWYLISVNTAGVRSPNPMIVHVRDTTFRTHFRTSDLRDDGKVSGEVTLADSLAKLPDSSFVVVRLVSSASGEIQSKRLPAGVHQYLFDRVPGGTYRVQAYLALGAGGKFDAGNVRPWRFAAPSGEYPAGEITVRPRWEVAKVNIELR